MAGPTRIRTNKSGSAVKTEPFDHLIQHVKQYDVRLWEALKRASTQINQIQTIVTTNSAKDEDKVTFGINADLVDDGKSLTNYYVVRRPGTLIDCVGKILPPTDNGEPPSGSDAILQIWKSVNDGATWIFLFPQGSGDSWKLVFPAGLTPIVKRTYFAFGSVAAGDLLKITCEAKGSTDPGRGMEIVLRWKTSD